MLQRIYGVCFPTKEELEAHLQLLEEAKERDHRKIGKDMNLFMVDDLVGRGLPMYMPKGYTIWQELENYIKDKERKLGYLHVMIPCVGTVNLYKTSGHWDHYKENMFPPMEMEGESFVLRPMNCPHHMIIYDIGIEYTEDFCLPAKFKLSYIDSNGDKKTPVVLHRAILESLDRFMAYILEETKGNLPTWLAPVQVRVELDDRNEKLGYRMRDGQVEKIKQEIAEKSREHIHLK